MTHTPCILLFAGPNGSGKSTITGQYPLVGYYVNADEIQRVRNCDALEAAQIAHETRNYLVEKKQSFTMESVLSTPRNIELLVKAKQQGYYVFCIYVTTIHSSINVDRCMARYEAGGHGVGGNPDIGVDQRKIVDRYKRAMRLIPDLCQVCDRLLVFDNSMEKGKGKAALIAEMDGGKTTIHSSPLWSEENIRLFLNGDYSPDVHDK
nr:zeta toxin family protein [Clostridia bacterium]